MNRRRAMTLLELLVAIAILVALVGLTGALWAQTSDWAADEALHRSTLRLEHARAMLDRQWRERRPGVRLDGPEGGPHRFDGDRFEFVTGAPTLFPGAGLVRAEYLVERAEVAPGAAERWRLVYRERRVLHPAYSEQRAHDSIGRPAIDEVVVLDGCADLRWELFVPLPSEPGLDAEAPQPIEYAWRAPGDLPAPPVEERDQPDAESADRPEGPRALRVVGLFQETPFQWTIDLEPSR